MNQIKLPIEFVNRVELAAEARQISPELMLRRIVAMGLDVLEAHQSAELAEISQAEAMELPDKYDIFYQ